MSMVLNAFEPQAPFQVEVDPDYSAGVLEVLWLVRGPLPKLQAAHSLVARTGELWLDTVFEVFVRFGDEEQYFETNLSPHGMWNAYAFSGYRQGMKETDSVVVTQLKWEECTSETWHFATRYEMERPRLPAHLAFSCILHPGPYHFALKHGGPKPDFHARESFCCTLD